MTLSSPELPAADVQVWQPAEIAAFPARSAPAGPASGPAPTVASASVFEVSPTAGIPDAVLNPARLAAQSAGYVAGWNRGREAGQLAVEAETALIRAAEEDQARATRERIALAVSALHAAAESLERRSGPTGEQVEELILASAFQLAEALVGASLADDRIRGRAALRSRARSRPSRHACRRTPEPGRPRGARGRRPRRRRRRSPSSPTPLSRPETPSPPAAPHASTPASPPGSSGPAGVLLRGDTGASA